MLHELRRQARALVRVPGLTTISILTIALGIGAGTSLFSVVKAVLLNPLPYPDPGRLTWIAEVNESGHEIQVAYRNFVDRREQSHSFTSMAAYADFPVIVARQQFQGRSPCWPWCSQRSGFTEFSIS